LRITVIENKILKEVSLFSNNIRFVLKNSKGSILPSSNFDVQKQSGNKYIFKGKGFGHGVGMCQWGSIKLSKQGINFKEILNFYFPKTEIKRIYD
jgi:stage II sporulation protein D